MIKQSSEARSPGVSRLLHAQPISSEMAVPLRKQRKTHAPLFFNERMNP